MDIGVLIVMSLWLAARWVLWNGMLAMIPVVLAYSALWISGQHALGRWRYLFIAVLLPVWFVFLPNTCYLVTEWRHFLHLLDAKDLYIRSQVDSSIFVPLLEMSLFYMLYSGFGMLTFTLATRPIERLAMKRNIPLWSWAIPFFTLVSLGVYLGLVPRFNSWDMIHHPKIILNVIASVAGHPRLAGFIVIFGMFLWLAYEALDLWIDGFSERWKQIISKYRKKNTNSKNNKLSESKR